MRLARNKFSIKGMLAYLLGFALCGPCLVANAQTQISRGTLGAGSISSGGLNNSISGTLGQTVVGRSANESRELGIGFWVGPPFPTAVDETPPVPSTFGLQQNHPNPFNPSTTIRFSVPRPARVVLTLYDIRGREVRRLLDEVQEPGNHELVVRAEDLTSGVYFYAMEAGDFRETRRFVLLK